MKPAQRRKANNLVNYLEVRTKITSVFPFLMALAYLKLMGRPIDPLRSGIFFAGMLLFDLTATAINNRADINANPDLRSLSQGKANGIVLILLALSIGLGLWLAALTDLVILLAGALCFAFGILYSWGPLPLSHGPFGEAASGFFYGVMIPYILIRINAPDYVITYGLSAEQLSVQIQLVPAVGFALLTVLPFCLTAAIMLANNICDADRDVRLGRHTLAFYLKEKALPLFAALYYAAYASVILMVAADFLPAVSLLLLATLVPVRRNIRAFMQKQDKKETFRVSISNFLLILPAHAALIWIGSMMPAGRLR
jgi:1,4-dihydroxy-2-naphthoate octaprenyltransferase